MRCRACRVLYLLRSAPLSCCVHPWALSFYSWICVYELRGSALHLQQEVGLTGRHTHVILRDHKSEGHWALLWINATRLQHTKAFCWAASWNKLDSSWHCGVFVQPVFKNRGIVMIPNWPLLRLFPLKSSVHWLESGKSPTSWALVLVNRSGLDWDPWELKWWRARRSKCWRRGLLLGLDASCLAEDFSVAAWAACESPSVLEGKLETSSLDVSIR